MRMVTGAVLLLAAEHSYAHTYMIGFPSHDLVAGVLLPAAIGFGVLGAIILTWELLTELRSTPPNSPVTRDSSP
ncbi:MAG: hypothetical protein R3B90_12030 [Planctomycetaceae bacterium]